MVSRLIVTNDDLNYLDLSRVFTQVVFDLSASRCLYLRKREKHIPAKSSRADEDQSDLAKRPRDPLRRRRSKTNAIRETPDAKGTM